MALFGRIDKDLAFKTAEEEARKVQRVNRVEKLIALGEELCSQLASHAEAGRADIQTLINAVSRHIDVTSTFLRRIEDLHVPKLKYHIVFLVTVEGPAPQCQGDCILTLKMPLDTESAVKQAKRDIQDMLKLAKEPVLISWRQLNE